jgi:hypothetical protein
MSFVTGMNVDVVPAARLETPDAFGNTRFDIPDANEGRWLTTVPRRHTTLITNAVSTGGDQFRRTIKYIKHWNARIGAGLQSYHIENIALMAVSPAWNNDPSWATLMWFSQAEKMIGSPLFRDGEQVDTYLSFASRQRAAALIREHCAYARSGWFATAGPSSNHRSAIVNFKRVFGQAFPSYG